MIERRREIEEKKKLYKPISTRGFFEQLFRRKIRTLIIIITMMRHDSLKSLKAKFVILYQSVRILQTNKMILEAI